MARNDRSTAEIDPTCSVYEQGLTVTPGLHPKRIRKLRKALAINGTVLPQVIGVSEGYGPEKKRSTLLIFEDHTTAEEAVITVESVMGRKNP